MRKKAGILVYLAFVDNLEQIHMTAGHSAPADQVPVKRSHWTMRWRRPTWDLETHCRDRLHE